MRNHRYKILLLIIKYAPWIQASVYFLGTILMYFGIYNALLSWIGFIGLFPLLILYLCSIVFEFCTWHRLPLYYILLCNILNLLNWFGLSILTGLWFHFIIIGFLILFGAYLKNKHNEQIRSTKDLPS